MTHALRRFPEPAGQRSTTRGQTSHPNPFEGRGRSVQSLRRASGRLSSTLDKRAFVAWWADLVARRCGTREACAVMLDVTFQTACNWFDGFSCATGDKVALACTIWPEEFAALAEGVAA